MEKLRQVPIRRGYNELRPLNQLLIEGGCEEKVFIAGGYAGYMAGWHESQKDIDLFLTKELDYGRVYKLLADTLTVEMETSRAVTFTRYSNPFDSFFSVPPIQLIKPVITRRYANAGKPETVLHSFDLALCQICFFLNRLVLYATKAAFDSYEENCTILRNIRDPVYTILRLQKYKERGYSYQRRDIIEVMNSWCSMSDEEKQEVQEREGTIDGES